jgi:hypothetical protein
VNVIGTKCGFKNK